MSVIGLDIGTTGCKAIVFSKEWNILAQSKREYSILTPQATWAEQDAELVWDLAMESLAEAVNQCKSDSPEAIARLQKINPTAYIKVVHPAPNREGLFEPTKVAHMDLLLYTNENISDEIIYKVVKAIYENKPDLVASFKAFKPFDPERIAMPVKGIDYHPGALKFFKEIGLWPPKK